MGGMVVRGGGRVAVIGGRVAAEMRACTNNWIHSALFGTSETCDLVNMLSKTKFMLLCLPAWLGLPFNTSHITYPFIQGRLGPIVFGFYCRSLVPRLSFYFHAGEKKSLVHTVYACYFWAADLLCLCGHT